MKGIIIAIIIMLLSMGTVFSQQPSELTEKRIDNYLTALKGEKSAERIEALKQLNELQAEYPEYKIKEFDDFLTSKIMERTTKNWIALLSSPSDGIRHSTLHVLANLKSDFPQMNMSVFNDGLKKMINNDPSQHLQIDAKIAMIYINSTALATSIKLGKDMSPGDVFNIIHVEMDKMFEQEQTLAEM